MKFPKPAITNPPPPPPDMPVIGEFTENIDLFLPDRKCGYDVGHFNYNFEKLDEKVGEISAAIEGGVGTSLDIVGGGHIEVVKDGDIRIINYVETWKPKTLPIKK